MSQKDAKTRREFLRLGTGAAIGLAGLGDLGCAPKKPGIQAKPNIVLIVADDMGFSDIGCYGSEIPTPNIDRLAADGLRFTQFYNMARCCPTRASLLTGLYPHQAGVGLMTEDLGIPAYQGDLNRQCVTIGEAIGKAGYRTAAVGKWHVTPGYKLSARHNWPVRRGFETYYGEILGAGSYFDPPVLVRDETIIKPEESDYYYTDALTHASIETIREFSKNGDPFFLYLAYTAPHWPLHAFPDDIDTCRPLYRHGWDVLRSERHQRLIELGIVDPRWPLTPRDERVPAWPDEPHKEWQIERMAVYAAMIVRMDQGIGRIMIALTDLGLNESTLVMFLSDNGGCAEELPLNMRSILPDFAKPLVPEHAPDGRPVRSGNHPSIMPGPPYTYASYGVPWANASNTPFRLYKHWIHEGGIATPFIAYWPAVIKEAGITDQPGLAVDLMATCLDVAGAAYPERYDGRAILPLEGKSLRPIFEGNYRDGHEAMCWEHEGNRAVRRGRWKLVNKFPDQWELYDIEADRTELNNLAKQHPKLVEELARIYDQWADRCGVRAWNEMRKKVQL